MRKTGINATGLDEVDQATAGIYVALRDAGRPEHEAYEEAERLRDAIMNGCVPWVAERLAGRQEIAAEVGTTTAAVDTWVNRYPDFPALVLDKYRWMPAVLDYCKERGLPKWSRRG